MDHEHKVVRSSISDDSTLVEDLFCTRGLGRTPDLNRQPLIHHSKRHKYSEETLKRHNWSNFDHIKKRLIRALPASFVVAHLIGRWRRAPHHADIMLTHGTASLQLQPSRDALLVVDVKARQDEHTLTGERFKQAYRTLRPVLGKDGHRKAVQDLARRSG